MIALCYNIICEWCKLIINDNSTDTAVSEIEDTFKRFIKRDDIDIILINQNVSILIKENVILITILLLYYWK